MSLLSFYSPVYIRITKGCLTIHRSILHKLTASLLPQIPRIRKEEVTTCNKTTMKLSHTISLPLSSIALFLWLDVKGNSPPVQATESTIEQGKTKEIRNTFITYTVIGIIYIIHWPQAKSKLVIVQSYKYYSNEFLQQNIILRPWH